MKMGYSARILFGMSSLGCQFAIPLLMPGNQAGVKTEGCWRCCHGIFTVRPNASCMEYDLITLRLYSLNSLEMQVKTPVPWSIWVG